MSPLRYLAMAVLLALSLSTAATALPTKILDGHIILDNADAFFPLGVYMHNATPELLAVVSDAGFNSVLSYDFGPGYNNLSNYSQVQTFLDDAHILDLQVIYAMNGFFDRPPYNQTRGAEWARGIATTFRDHPALAIYYTTDEPPESWIPDLVRRRAMLKATDPDHITMSIFICTQNAGNFLAVSDAIGYDPYPWQNCCDPTVTAHCSNKVQHQNVVLAPVQTMCGFKVPSACRVNANKVEFRAKSSAARRLDAFVREACGLKARCFIS